MSTVGRDRSSRSPTAERLVFGEVAAERDQQVFQGARPPEVKVQLVWPHSCARSTSDRPSLEARTIPRRGDEPGRSSAISDVADVDLDETEANNVAATGSSLRRALRGRVRRRAFHASFARLGVRGLEVAWVDHHGSSEPLRPDRTMRACTWPVPIIEPMRAVVE